jgi:hypothetical protein
MRLEIETTEEFINLFDENTNKIFNQIPIKEIGKTIVLHNKVHSFWIEKYTRHVLIRKRHMYKLAQYIRYQFPENKIDWFSQMYKVEYFQWLLDNEFIHQDSPEYFKRDTFEDNEEYLGECAAEVAEDELAIDIIKGLTLVELTKYGLL